ncbi:MAG: ABC transporter permease, partial [Candidatus Solibacter usitatus]|nr:ABC transporter permease [Candidatus Solibacter usitatus]
MLQFLPLIVKNSWRNRRRTSLTVASVAASLSLLGILMAIYHAFYFSEPAPEQALRLVARNKVSLIFPLPESYGQKIRAVPGVREVMMRQWFGGMYKDRLPQNMFARFAIEPDKLFTLRGEMRIPEDQKKAFQRERQGCLIGLPLAEKYNLKPGDRLTLQGDIYPGNYEFIVAGIYDSPGNNETLYFHRKFLEESMA